jgi:hypothetical protein
MAETKVKHSSVEERAAKGKRKREKTPVSSHMGWIPAPDLPDPVSLLDEPNALRLGLTEPYVAPGTTLNGSERTADVQQLEARSTPPRFTAYACLVLEMLKNDPMLFIRGAEAEEAWRIVDPVMSAWTAGDVPMQEYSAGGSTPPPVRSPRFRTGGGIRAREHAP